MRVIFLGGNGHCGARLGPARAALARRASEGRPTLEIVEATYPGFEGRSPASDLEAFLDAIALDIREAAEEASGEPLIYATGIGGLLALCLRARGEHLDVPVVMQAPVLWGLERRLMPRVMRFRLAQRALTRLFASEVFRESYADRHFTSPQSDDMKRSFFDGYAQSAALADFFTWLSPTLFRDLEDKLGQPHSNKLQKIAVWWGELDHVVPPKELKWTEEALGVRWRVRRFETWGHYPMIDDPEAWLDALPEALEDTERVSIV